MKKSFLIENITLAVVLVSYIVLFLLVLHGENKNAQLRKQLLEQVQIIAKQQEKDAGEWEQ